MAPGYGDGPCPRPKPRRVGPHLRTPCSRKRSPSLTKRLSSFTPIMRSLLVRDTSGDWVRWRRHWNTHTLQAPLMATMIGYTCPLWSGSVTLREAKRQAQSGRVQVCAAHEVQHTSGRSHLVLHEAALAATIVPTRSGHLLTAATSRGTPGRRLTYISTGGTLRHTAYRVTLLSCMC